MVKIIYDSLTGMCKKFANNLGYPSYDITEIENSVNIDDEIFLVTRCFNFGEIPEATLKFLDKYHNQVFACACGGNRNWGINYGVAGDKVEKKYGIKNICKFEASGFPYEREIVKEYIKNYINTKKIR